MKKLVWAGLSLLLSGSTVEAFPTAAVLPATSKWSIVNPGTHRKTKSNGKVAPLATISRRDPRLAAQASQFSDGGDSSFYVTKQRIPLEEKFSKVTLKMRPHTDELWVMGENPYTTIVYDTSFSPEMKELWRSPSDPSLQSLGDFHFGPLGQKFMSCDVASGRPRETDVSRPHFLGRHGRGLIEQNMEESLPHAYPRARPEYMCLGTVGDSNDAFWIWDGGHPTHPLIRYDFDLWHKENIVVVVPLPFVELDVRQNMVASQFALDQKGRKLYISDTTHGGVIRVDMNVPHHPTDMTEISPTHQLWPKGFQQQPDTTYYQVTAEYRKILRSIRKPTGMALMPDKCALFIHDMATGLIHIMSTTTMEQVGEIPTNIFYPLTLMVGAGDSLYSVDQDFSGKLYSVREIRDQDMRDTMADLFLIHSGIETEVYHNPMVTTGRDTLCDKAPTLQDVINLERTFQRDIDMDVE